MSFNVTIVRDFRRTNDKYVNIAATAGSSSPISRSRLKDAKKNKVSARSNGSGLSRV
jgi:hypothetical protein